jgi:integrase
MSARRTALPPGIEVRRYKLAAGGTTETFAVRWKEPGGTRRRRAFDTREDALDFQAKLRSARRWRPAELRQEHAGRTTLDEFFTQWWIDHAMVELRRSTLAVYRCLWEAHAEPRLGGFPIAEIDARRVVRFRGELLAAGVGPTSVIKTMSMLQRVFRDAVEYGEVAHNPFKAVQKPTASPPRAVVPLTPLQVEQLANDLEARGYATSAVLVRLMAYTGLRPQEALGLQWRAVGTTTLLIDVANADGELDQLKNRKRSRKRSRTVDLMAPTRGDLDAYRRSCCGPENDDLVFPHDVQRRLWTGEEYRTWRRRIYVPSAENTGLSTPRPYDLRHTWASLRIAEKRLSIAEIAEQFGDKVSTMLDTYTHVINEWRGRKSIDIEREIENARKLISARGGQRRG